MKKRRIHNTPDVTEPSSEMSQDCQTQTEPPKMKDASVQWYDATIADHTYVKSEQVIRTQAKSTQTDPVPDVSVPVLDDNSVKFYTGLSKDAFWALLTSLLIYLPLSSVCKFKLAVHDQLLLVLMRLRLALMFTDLGGRFKISRTTACDIFATWLPLMAKYMWDNVIYWPSRDTLSGIRPQSFMQSFPRATCIIDCTEIFVQRAKNLKKRAQTFSNYKSHNTYKALYCVAPNGFVMYVSKLFGGRASDVFITQNSGFGENLLPGDEVLADRGFTIDGILPQGVTLTIPAFTKGHKDRRLPEEEVTRTRRIANVRIHVERAIRRLKCFKLLSNIIPARVKNVDDILAVCAGLCNLQPPLIREDIDDVEIEEMELDDSDDDNEENECMDMFDIAEVDF